MKAESAIRYSSLEKSGLHKHAGKKLGRSSVEKCCLKGHRGGKGRRPKQILAALMSVLLNRACKAAFGTCHQEPVEFQPLTKEGGGGQYKLCTSNEKKKEQCRKTWSSFASHLNK